MAGLTQEQREQGIVKTSIIGIVANIALAAFKAAVGLISNSIAIVLDAVNNLSDAMSSVITIIGAKLANKRPDHNHPFGYGRVEYMATTIIGAIVLAAGISSASEALHNIVEPQQPSYSAPSLVIVGVAVVAKLVLGTFFRKRGKELGSDSLVASGDDARMDSLVSASTLVAALISVLAEINLEAWIGLAISVLIIKTGIDILRDAVSKILGERVDGEITTKVKHTVASVEGVRGAYDLILNDYGPSRMMGSVHIEVDEGMSARRIDGITREVQKRVMEQCGVTLHTVGIYSMNSDADEKTSTAAAIAGEVKRLQESMEHVRETHALYVDPLLKTASLDVVVDFEAPDRREVLRQMKSRLEEAFPGYGFSLTLDADISD